MRNNVILLQVSLTLAIRFYLGCYRVRVLIWRTSSSLQWNSKLLEITLESRMSNRKVVNRRKYSRFTSYRFLIASCWNWNKNKNKDDLVRISITIANQTHSMMPFVIGDHELFIAKNRKHLNRKPFMFVCVNSFGGKFLFSRRFNCIVSCLWDGSTWQENQKLQKFEEKNWRIVRHGLMFSLSLYLHLHLAQPRLRESVSQLVHYNGDHNCSFSLVERENNCCSLWFIKSMILFLSNHHFFYVCLRLRFSSLVKCNSIKHGAMALRPQYYDYYQLNNERSEKLNETKH